MTRSEFVHQGILARFAGLLGQKRLAHAYLFIGQELSGKSETALAVAQLINCELNMDGELAQGCGTCPTCVKIGSGNHPDVMMVETGETASIKIAAVREVISRVQLKPYEARKKVFIIRDADLLTMDAGNALLKTLEEPADNSILILTTRKAELLLSTLRSRCQAMYFWGGAREDVLRALDGRHSSEENHFLAFFTEGCLGRARNLQDEGLGTVKNEIIDNFMFSRNNDAYLKSLAADTEKLRLAVEVLLSWFRDIMILKAGAGQQQVMHIDRWEDLEKMTALYDIPQLEDIVQKVVETREMSNGNFNVKIPLMLLKEKIWRKSLRSE